MQTHTLLLCLILSILSVQQRQMNDGEVEVYRVGNDAEIDVDDVDDDDGDLPGLVVQAEVEGLG
jgi:hypothetical protein